MNKAGVLYPWTGRVVYVLARVRHRYSERSSTGSVEPS